RGAGRDVGLEVDRVVAHSGPRRCERAGPRRRAALGGDGAGGAAEDGPELLLAGGELADGPAGAAARDGAEGLHAVAAVIGVVGLSRADGCQVVEGAVAPLHGG